MRSQQSRGRGARVRRFGNSPKRGGNSTDIPTATLDLGILEDRTLFSATPLMLDAVDVAGAEDSPLEEIDLRSLFSVDDGGQTVHFELFDNSLPELFDEASIVDGDRLLLQLADNAHGSAELSIRATNAQGQIEILPIHLEIESINDAPTAGNLQDFATTDLQSGRTVVDLFGAFDDLEDADTELTFTIQHNSRPDLFTSIEIDMEQGVLILEHAPNKTGSAELTIVATDTGHLSVGMGTAAGFKVYDQFGAPHTSDGQPSHDLSLSDLTLWTSWYFFEYTDGSYDFSTLDVDKFTSALRNFPADAANSPLVLDIENHFYDNTPEGRDRFAEVLHLANELRPDLDIGYYMFMPERNWHQPTRWARTLDHLELGLTTWFTRRADTFEQDVVAWHDRNELYRTENVSQQYGGGPLADMVDHINASLYTFYRNTPSDPFWRVADVDPVANTFTVDGPSFDTVDIARLLVTDNGVLNNGLSTTGDYYVVNVHGNTFQLAATPGGAPIDFTDNFTGRIAVGAKGPVWENMWHDPNVIYWQDYAEQNIAEARKFDKPVNAWISPSYRGLGTDHIEGDFFRWQLEVLRPIVDSITIYDFGQTPGDELVRQGWWTALNDFMGTLDTPAATFRVTIPDLPTPDPIATPTSNDSPAPDPATPPAVEPSEPPPSPGPVAMADSFSVNEGQALTFTAAALLNNDTNVSGPGVGITILAQPLHGELHQIGANDWRYMPDPGYSGLDAFSYRIYDGIQFSEAALVQIQVNAAETPLTPQANPDQLHVHEDRPLSFRITDLLANDKQVDLSKMSFEVATGPSNGMLSRNADGSMIYRPQANFHGTDEFAYALRDQTGRVIDTAAVAINVIALNDRPIAVADRLAATEDTPLNFTAGRLLRNDSDAENDSLVVQIVQGPRNGRLIDLGDGQFRYIPNANFSGEDQFQYRVFDGEHYSLTTVAAIDVQPVNDAPVAQDDHFVLDEDDSLIIAGRHLLGNDIDVDSASLAIEIVDGPQFGKLEQRADGSFAYTPNPNHHGMDRFGYRVSDGQAVSEMVAVHLTIRPVNDAPTASGESYVTQVGATLAVPSEGGVLANDRDIDGDALRANVLNGPRFGTLELSPSGGFAYRPNTGFSGNDSFDYRVIDAAGAVSIATARIRVEPIRASVPVNESILSTTTSATTMFGTKSAFASPPTNRLSSFASTSPNSDDQDEHAAFVP